LEVVKVYGFYFLDWEGEESACYGGHLWADGRMEGVSLVVVGWEGGREREREKWEGREKSWRVGDQPLAKKRPDIQRLTLESDNGLDIRSESDDAEIHRTSAEVLKVRAAKLEGTYNEDAVNMIAMRH